MIQLVYTSYARQRFDRASLTSLVNSAQRENARSGVTGILVYVDMNFMQLLEGPTQEVVETFSRITADPKHGDIVELSRHEVETRSCSDWTMALAYVPEDLNSSALSDALSDYEELRQALGAGDSIGRLFANFAGRHARYLA